MARREEPRDWADIAADVARTVAPWPKPRARAGAAVAEALGPNPPSIRRKR